MKKYDLLIFGDICPDINYKELFNKENGVIGDSITELINKSSLTIGNLECPATISDKPIIKCGPSLMAKPSDIEYLKHVGIDALSLANNHILDYGEVGINDTLEALEENGIDYFGVAKKNDLSRVALIKRIGDKTVAVISFAEAEFNLAFGESSGANHFDPYTSFDDIHKLKARCDYVVVLYHGGIEYYKNPSPLLQKKCRKMVQSGADLVLCQHSHCVGTKEVIDGSTIIYGQGNSVFGYVPGNDSWNEGFAVTVIIETGEVELHLLNAEERKVVLADSHKSKKRIAQMESDSEKINDYDFIKSSWDEYCKKNEALDLALLYGRGRVFNKINRLLNNLLIKIFYSRKKQMITMNLLRCESHHEVVQTIMENEIFKF